jgi:hypothetical protein
MTSSCYSCSIVLLVFMFILNHQTFGLVPQFPKQFTMKYSVMTDSYTTRFLFAQDELKQKAYVEAHVDGQSEPIYLGWLLHSPPGALPDSPESKYMVDISYTPGFSDCAYHAFWNYTNRPQFNFPRHYFVQQKIGWNAKVVNFYDTPDHMILNGTVVINNKKYTRYETPQRCKYQNVEYPCQSIYFTADEHELPFQSIFVKQKQSDMDQEEYITTSYEFLEVAPPANSFWDINKLPKNWATSCDDGNRFIVTNPEEVQVHPGVTQYASISLGTPPHTINGTDVVTIQLFADKCSPCRTLDCIAFSPEEIKFNSKNWNIPQQVKILYAKRDGQESIVLRASGGGYTDLPDYGIDVTSSSTSN